MYEFGTVFVIDATYNIYCSATVRRDLPVPYTVRTMYVPGTVQHHPVGDR